MQGWLILARAGWKERVTQHLKQIGATVTSTLDDYLVCRGPADLPEALRGCQSVLQVTPLEDGAELVAPEKAPAPAPPAFQVGDLVSVHVCHGHQMQGRIHAIDRGKAIVHAWWCDKTITVTAPLEQLAKIELPEPWR